MRFVKLDLDKIGLSWS